MPLLLLLVLVGCGPATCKTDLSDLYVDPAVGTTFAQYRREPTHQGLAPEGAFLDPDLTVTWRSEAFAIGTYTASKGSPVLDADRVYVGIDDGYLRALDRETGELVWEFETHQAQVEEDREGTENRGIHGTPAVADGVVWIGDYSGWLYALEADTGELIWEVDLGGSIGASPVYADGYIFISVEYPTPNGKMFVVDAEGGCVVFETPYLGEHPHSSVSVDTGRHLMTTGANNGLMAAYDYVDGTLLWESWMDEGEDGDIKSTPAIAGDTVYITSWDHKLHAVDITNGERRFSFETDSITMSSPSYYDGVVYVGSHDSMLYAIDAEGDYADDQDRELWHLDTAARIMSSATVLPNSNNLVIGSSDFSIYMVDLDDGSVQWSHALDDVVTSVPTVEGSSLYVTDAAGVTWRFD